ncbi:MAG: efflux RND transporter periplasmic adaptor subunit [Thermodesulfobacteriota bacterium]|nr:efflux RND transporter periplasmic adaptor subunit [Thermodesulfobacteriota bacterium]
MTSTGARSLFVFIFFITLIFLGCSPDVEEDRSSEKERIANVKVFKVQRGDLASYISATGTLAPGQEARIGPKVEGRIEKIYVDEGDFVEKGKELIKLEQETYFIDENRAKATLNTARAYLEKVEVNLKNVAKDWNRLASLYKEGTVSEQRFDKIDTEYTAAQSELNLAKAKVKEADANLAMAKQHLKESVTYAPFSGFIVEKLMEEGEVSNWVTYQWDVLHLQDISKVKIECPIAETKISYLCPGKDVRIEVDAFPTEVFTGGITAINPRVDPNSRTFIVKIEIPNQDFELKAGMFARVKIAEEEKKQVILIPKEGLLVSGEKHMVFKIEEDQATPRTIEIGISDGRLVEVIEGLEEGELIVIEGLYALKEGTRVRVF